MSPHSFSRFLTRPPLLSNPNDTHHPVGAQQGDRDLQQTVNPPLQFGSLPPVINQSFLTDQNATPQQLVECVRSLKQILPVSVLFGPDDLRIIGSFPYNGGGSAEVWLCERSKGHTVVIKSYRLNSSSSHLPAFLRLYREALVGSYLNEIGNGRFAPFLGIYSSLDHPLSLVFDHMEHGDLGEYLRSNPQAVRAKLLLQTAQGLQIMHDRGIVHGNIKISNVLIDVDGHVRIGGLGAAFVQATTPAVEVDRFFHGAAPEIADPQSLGVTDTEVSEASDIFAFGVLAWEVFAGRAPFSDEGLVAGIHSMASGRRPDRPVHPQLSNTIWKLIKECWKADPAERKRIAEVVGILEAE